MRTARRSRRIIRDNADIPPRGMRRLIVGGMAWYWRYGDPVTIRSPDGKGTRIPLGELTGMSEAEAGRSVEKGNMSVRPCDVASWIARSMLGYTDREGFPADVSSFALLPPQPGTRSVLGPRGRWRWRPGPWNTTIISPEGVATEVRTYRLLNMTMDEWLAAKCDIIRGMRDSVRGILRQSDTLRLIDCDLPGMPVPDDTAVTAWVAALAGPSHD